MKQIVLDTETTGLDPKTGHRLIEIGCIELVNRRYTGRYYHQYLRPERKIDWGAKAVHGMTDAFLADKPLFSEIVEDFLAFISGAELIIHNAPFDIGFIDHEFALAHAQHKISTYCTILDTLVFARKKHPGARNSLDALCKRYSIDNTHRQYHGALLDARILGDVYLAMTSGQTSFCFSDAAQEETTTMPLLHKTEGLPILFANPEELAAHQAYLEKNQRTLLPK